MYRSKFACEVWRILIAEIKCCGSIPSPAGWLELMSIRKVRRLISKPPTPRRLPNSGFHHISLADNPPFPCVHSRGAFRPPFPCSVAAQREYASSSSRIASVAAPHTAHHTDNGIAGYQLVSVITMAPTGPKSSQPQRRPSPPPPVDESPKGPSPGNIALSNQYRFEQNIRRLQKEYGCDPAREDSYRIQGVQLIDSVRHALRLYVVYSHLPAPPLPSIPSPWPKTDKGN